MRKPTYNFSWTDTRKKIREAKTFSKTDRDYLIRCIGYLPDIRKYYIDREIKGVKFSLYSYSRGEIEKYISKKMNAINVGYLKVSG